MALSISKLSVSEIRSLYLEQDGNITAYLLAKLRKDPRGGVRRIGQLLRQKRRRALLEQRRVETLLECERWLWRLGCSRVAGVDEVGVGPLAGPVVAAAVVFPPDVFILDLDDSKKLDRQTRLRLDEEIRSKASAIGIGEASVQEIDQLNVYWAAVLAMKRAVENLPRPPEHLLIDARSIPDLPIPQQAVVAGDSRHFSIAAASVIAKTYRDARMAELDLRFPAYGFKKHKGYSTPEHQHALKQHGPCAEHRKSYGFVQEIGGLHSDLFYQIKQKLSTCPDSKQLAACRREFETTYGQFSLYEQKKLRFLLKKKREVLIRRQRQLSLLGPG